MSPNARADDSHDGRYTHPESKREAPDPNAPPLRYPKMLHGKAYVKEGKTVRDTVTVHSAEQEAEEMKTGAWKEFPGDWDKPAAGDGPSGELTAYQKEQRAKAYRKAQAEGGFARLGTMVLGFLAALTLLTVATFAQTAIFTTTLGAALPAPSQGNQQTSLTLASGTNVAVGQGVFVDREYMRIIAATPQTTIWTVARGQDGTPSTRHNNAATVWFGPPNLFEHSIRYSVGGACVSTNQQALPYINTQLAQISNCPVISTLAGSAAASWDAWFLGGNPNFQATRASGYTYVTAGAIVIQSGTSYIGSAGALAMTLANPAAYQEGLIMTIEASTAHAHTITPATGFYGVGSTACTLGGAIGDGLTIYAHNSLWWVLALHNCTIA